MPQEIVLCIFFIRNSKWTSPKGLWNLCLKLFATEGRERRFWFDFWVRFYRRIRLLWQFAVYENGNLTHSCAAFPISSWVLVWLFPELINFTKPSENVLIFLGQFLKWIGKGNQLAERAFWVSSRDSSRCLTITKSSSHLLDILCCNWFVGNELFNILDKWKNKHLSRILF